MLGIRFLAAERFRASHPVASAPASKHRKTFVFDLIKIGEGFGADDVLRRGVGRNHVGRVPAFGDDAVNAVSLF